MIRKILYGLLTAIAIAESGHAQSIPQSTNIGGTALTTGDSLAAGPQIQTGYYTLPKKDLSGSVGYLPAKTFLNVQTPNFQSAMQGKIAGVQIIQANGQPGSDVTVRVRGTSSIYGSTEPLYIIDGIPVFAGPREKAEKGVGSGWGSVFNPLSDINPGDIESIVVLKDAAAAAIYGARGGNGVILVTTKKGGKNNSEVNFNYSEGVTNLTNRVNVLNGPQYLELLDKAWVNSGQTGQGPFEAASGLTRAVASTTDTQQLDEALGLGSVRQLSLSTSYASDKTSFYASGSYRNEKGIITGNDMARYSGKMSISNQISKRLAIGIRGGLTYSNYASMPVGYGPGGGFNAGQLNLPVYPLFVPTGRYFFPSDPAVTNLPGSNIASFQNNNDFDNHEQVSRVVIAGTFNYSLSKDLLFNTDASMENYFHQQSNYVSKRLRNGSIGSGVAYQGLPAAYNGYEKYTNNVYSINSSLVYKKAIANHRITGLAGFEITYNENPYFFAEAEGYVSESSRQPAIGGYRNQITPEALVANTYSFVGYFANANYAFKEKYLLGATLRYDGSSRYGADNKYLLFPAASLGWLVSEENFLKQVSAINSLKLRASYGKTGNSGIGNYGSVERWEVNSNSKYLLQSGIQIAGLGLSSLKPEQQTQFDLGVDFAIFNNRISGEVDYYNKLTTDMLLNYNAPLSAGVSQTSLLINAGSLRNRGVEVNLASKNIVGRAFGWNTEFAIAHNTNTVLDLGGLNSTQVSSHVNIGTYIGYPIGVFNLAEYAGVNASGQEMIYDLDGNAVVATSAAQLNAARKPQFNKPSAPKLFGGLNNTFTYKHFDMSAFMTFSIGNYVLDEGERQLSYVRGNNNLRETAYAVDFPKLVYNDPISNTNTTRFLHDASYLRMKNVTLGYSFKQATGKLKFLKDARVYLSGQNLFTVTKFPGWDPEVSGNYTTNLDRSLNQGITYLDLPQLRTFAAGINMKF